jgi:hypothetical protein
MGEVTVRGAEELALVAARLRQVGDRDLRKELLSGLNRATKPLKEDVKQSALRTLPQRGGYARQVAAGKIATKNRMTGRNPGVRVVSQLGRGADRGQLRHPVFGNKQVWVVQPVTPGWFTKPLETGADKVRGEVLDVLEQVARKLAQP